ncbi:MAG: hypothetical protein HOL15_11255 [Nitrospinaceae bacterium]|nr:hypothetical protein [Nitrospinaceae bacterium]
MGVRLQSRKSATQADKNPHQQDLVKNSNFGFKKVHRHWHLLNGNPEFIVEPDKALSKAIEIPEIKELQSFQPRSSRDPTAAKNLRLSAQIQDILPATSDKKTTMQNSLFFINLLPLNLGAVTREI